jgi:hypothetical protein
MARTWHHTPIQRRDPDMLQYHLWFKNEPKWWRKIYKHRKRRAEWKSLRERIMQGADLDSVVYPLDSRPWIYYW